MVVEELMETVEILSDDKLMKSIARSLKDVQENRVHSYEEMVKELGFEENELDTWIYISSHSEKVDNLGFDPNIEEG